MNFLSFLDFLVEPAFIDRNNPPLKVNVSATVLGWIAVVLSVVAVLALLLIGVRSMFVAGPHPGIFILALVGLILLLISWLMALLGAWQMTQGYHSGRRLLIQALALAVIFSLVYNIGLSNMARFILQLVINAIFYYFVVISRFPDEAPPVASAAMVSPPPGSPPQSPGG